MILLIEILSLTTFLFFTGMIGVALNRKNIIITMMSIELMLLAVNLNFLIFSQQFDDIVGQIFVLFILTIAASESAIGLAILSLYNSTKNTITYEVLKNMHHNFIYQERKAYSYLLPERIKKAAGLWFRQIEERNPNYFIFFAGTMFLLVCCFFYIYVVSLESLSLKDQINSLNAKNQLLEQQIQNLVDLLNKLRAARHEKPKDFMGPYQKSFCAIACVVVALGVCAYLWPAPFVAIKKGIFAYFFGSGDDSNTGSGDDSYTGFGADKKTFFDDDIQTYITPATDGSGVEWMVKVSNEKLSEILIKTCDSPAFIPINNYLDIMDRCVSIAVADPNHPFYRDFPGLLSTAIAGLSQAPLMPL